MCICFVCPGKHPVRPFCVLFNREESLLRTTAPVHRWEEDPNIIGGTDTALGGSWFAVNTKTGNIAFLTNLSDDTTSLPTFELGKQSRGKLISDFVASDFKVKNTDLGVIDNTDKNFDNKTMALWGEALSEKFNDQDLQINLRDILAYAFRVLQSAKQFNPFNLCVGNLRIRRIFFVEIVDGRILEFDGDSINGFSNNWYQHTVSPRAEHGIQQLELLINDKGIRLTECLALMKDSRMFEADTLKQGLPIFCKPMFNFIGYKLYGTISTAALVETSPASFKLFEITYDYDLEKIKAFILHRKSCYRLKNYVKLAIFLMKAKIECRREQINEFDFIIN